MRWRLAGTSASLTLIILLVFGGVVGKVATNRIRDDFNGEVQQCGPDAGGGNHDRLHDRSATGVHGPELDDFVRSDNASARVYDFSGHCSNPAHNAALARPRRPGPLHLRGLRVQPPKCAAKAAARPATSSTAAASSTSTRPIDRLWLFIAAGVLGGTLLAILAGLAIADRAMRPVSSLTATARKIADTGDPSRHMPEPKADDEVGELARTLEQMLRSLDAARTEREAAMKKQREFVADASHELRTPLTSILANLELLQASLREPGHDDDRAMVDSALRSSQRMSRLVADLLLLARADAGKRGGHRRCDLAEVAGNAAAEAAPLMGDRELRVENEHPLWLEGNRDELHRMVLNLLDNAARHTPPGSTRGAAPASRGRRRGARGRRRRPGDRPRAARPGLRPLRPGRGPGRHRRRRRQRPRPGDRQRRRGLPRRHRDAGESPRGGALFRVRLPLPPLSRKLRPL